MAQYSSSWRLIPILDAPGQWQMAIDSWLLERHLSGLHPPTLRFYTWSPPAISLGYHQRRYPDFWEDLTWQGKPLDLVRRPTGGRAVLHQGDLTYAVIGSGFKGTRIEVYEYICQFLIEGWRKLGVDLHYGSAGKGYIHNPNCFGTATGADLVLADETKLIGSAQLKRGNAVLQHGSMRLHPDPDLFKLVFGESELGGVELGRRLPQGDSAERSHLEVISALIEAASSSFGIEFITKPLSEAEMDEVVQFRG